MLLTTKAMEGKEMELLRTLTLDPAKRAKFLQLLQNDSESEQSREPLKTNLKCGQSHSIEYRPVAFKGNGPGKR